MFVDRSVLAGYAAKATKIAAMFQVDSDVKPESAKIDDRRSGNLLGDK